MTWIAKVAVLTCVAAFPAAAGVPAAQADGGDTHIVGVSQTRTLDCNGGTLFVNGAHLIVHAMGTCWAISTQGSENTIIAETVVNDITVYGNDTTVYYHNGDPLLFDRGRELGMTNRLQRVPA